MWYVSNALQSCFADSVQLQDLGLSIQSAEPAENGKSIQARQKAGDAVLEVVFEVDVNGILKVTAKEVHFLAPHFVRGIDG
jgi:molecular chaperone DnaK (HSP70)